MYLRCRHLQAILHPALNVLLSVIVVALRRSDPPLKNCILVYKYINCLKIKCELELKEEYQLCILSYETLNS